MHYNPSRPQIERRCGSPEPYIDNRHRDELPRCCVCCRSSEEGTQALARQRSGRRTLEVSLVLRHGFCEGLVFVFACVSLLWSLIVSLPIFMILLCWCTCHLMVGLLCFTLMTRFLQGMTQFITFVKALLK
jgi:hypothetical protein